MPDSVREMHSAHEVLEAWIGADRIKGRPDVDPDEIGGSQVQRIFEAGDRSVGGQAVEIRQIRHIGPDCFRLASDFLDGLIEF